MPQNFFSILSQKLKISQRKLLWSKSIGYGALLGAFILFFVFYSGKKVRIENSPAVAVIEDVQNNLEIEDTSAVLVEQFTFNPLTGEECIGGDKRPLAVMLAADNVARPLYGIAQADIVVEMPVLTGGITRYMGVFACGQTQEIGSIRSARHDFLPFVKSFDAIFAHWGGSYLALDILNTAVIDNIDSLINPFSTFYRRQDRKAPHNGFTSFALLRQAADKLYTRSDMQAGGYVRVQDEPILKTNQNISIGYPRPYNVAFSYDYKTNTYKRWRDGREEMDKDNGKQVTIKNLIIMRAKSRQINTDYNEVDIEGEGEVTVYRNGEAKKGTWKRTVETYNENSSIDNKYYFLDEFGREIGLVKGKTWISVVEPNQRVEMTFR